VRFEDLVLMPEVQARRILGDMNIELRVLAPVGAYAGCGTLRVLRVRPKSDREPEQIELICGYESYSRIA